MFGGSVLEDLVAPSDLDNVPRERDFVGPEARVL